MKLNNKGYLVAELVVASAMAMALAYFLIDLTVKVKNINDDYYIETTLETDKILMTREVMNDISSYNLASVNVLDENSILLEYKLEDGTSLYKRVELVDRVFQYGICDVIEDASENITDCTYNDPDIYKKTLKEEINDVALAFETIDLDTESGLIKINFIAQTLYSDYNYGVNIMIPYNKYTTNVSSVPQIALKPEYTTGVTITEGEDINIINYFDYDTDGTTYSCAYGDTVVNNTNELTVGTYDITCNISNSLNLSSSSTVRIEVQEKEEIVDPEEPDPVDPEDPSPTPEPEPDEGVTPAE